MKKKFLIILCIIVGAWILWSLGVLIVAKYRVVQAQSVSMKKTDNEVADAVRLFINSDIVLDRLGSSKADICYVNYHESGMFLVGYSWYQSCKTFYLEGFSTNLDEVSLRTKLAQLLVKDNIFGNKTFGKEYQQYGQYQNCALYTDKYGYKTILYLPPRTPTDAVLTNCKVPDQEGSSVISTAIRASLSRSKSRMFYGFDRNKIDNSHGQIWIMITRDYYYETLGSTLIFKYNPRPIIITAN